MAHDNWFDEKVYLAAKPRQLHAIDERDAAGAAYNADTFNRAIADSVTVNAAIRYEILRTFAE